MRRPLRTLLGPKWLALHLLVLAVGVAMVFLGRWQLDVSEGKGFSLQNFFYAFQWWTFTGFLLFFWFRVLRDEVLPPRPTEPTGEIVVSRPGDPAPGPGAALMVADVSLADDGAPTLYRGYVAPQLARDPDRRGDDSLRSPYNDYLWQLALADAAKGEGTMPTALRPLVDTATLADRASAARALPRPDTPALPATDHDSDGPGTAPTG